MPWLGKASLQPVAEPQLAVKQGMAGGEGYGGEGRITLLDAEGQPAVAFLGAGALIIHPRQVPGPADGAQL